MILELTEQALLSRMRNFEDHFVERKTSGNSKDWIKTVVGFANSAPDGYPCVLFIGVKDNGDIETPQVNLDSPKMCVAAQHGRHSTFFRSGLCR